MPASGLTALVTLVAATIATHARAQQPPLASAPKMLGQPLRMHDSDATAVAWSRDGKLAASAGWDGKVRVHDATNGKQVAAIAVGGLLTTVRFCGPKSERLVTLVDKQLVFFEPRTGKKLGAFAGSFQFLTVSPDGATVATTRNGAVVLVDALTAAERRVIDVAGAKDTLDAQCWSSDGTRLLVHDLMQGGAWLVDVPAGTVAGTWKWTTLTTNQAFAPDGKSVLAVARRALLRVAVPEGKVEQTWKLDATPASVVALPSGTHAIVGCGDGMAHLLDLRDGAIARSFAAGGGSIAAIALAPDGATLLTANRDGTVRFVRTSDWQEAYSSPAHGALVAAIAITADGKNVVSCSHDKSCIRWARDGKLVNKSSLHTNAVTAVVSAADQSCWTAGMDNVVRRADAAGKALAAIMIGDDDAHVQSLALDQQDKVLVAGHADGSVRWYDAGTAALLRKAAGHEGPVLHVRTAGDGSSVATGGADGVLLLWDAASATVKHRVDAHEGGVTGIVRLPDGSVVTSGLDRALRRWDTSTGAKAGEVIVAADASAAIGALAFLAPHGLLVAVSADALRFVTADGLRPAGERKGLPAVPTCAAAAADGSLLAVGFVDATVALWTTTPPAKKK